MNKAVTMNTINTMMAIGAVKPKRKLVKKKHHVIITIPIGIPIPNLVKGSTKSEIKTDTNSNPNHDETEKKNTTKMA